MTGYPINVDPYRYGESSLKVMAMNASPKGVVIFEGMPSSIPADITSIVSSVDSTPTEKTPSRWSKRPEKGDKVVWTRMLEKRPLAIVNLEYVTVASWGLPDVPLGVTLEEVAGVFPSGYFDPF